MIEGERRVERKIQDRDAEPADRLRVSLVAGAPDAVADSQASETRENAEHNAAGFANPLIVDGIFEEKRNEEDQRDGADTADPGEADLRFEFPRAAGIGRGLWNRGLQWRRAVCHFARNLNEWWRLRFRCTVGRGRRLRLAFAWYHLRLRRRHADSKRRLDARQ